ncbi:MAG TPA: hypothetical protein VGD14_18230 [bacterium]
MNGNILLALRLESSAQHRLLRTAALPLGNGAIRQKWRDNVKNLAPPPLPLSHSVIDSYTPKTLKTFRRKAAIS